MTERDVSAGRVASMVFAIVAMLATTGRADDDAAAIASFESKVRPILVERCQSCHGSEKAKGGLRLDSRRGLLAGGDSGPVVVAGKPEESPLVEAIGYQGAIQMPPRSKLPDAEIEALTRWVASGAAWPEGPEAAGAPAAVKAFDMAERRRHWSWQPVKRADPPSVIDQSWPSNDVDRFLLARLEAEGLKPSADADRPTLIRRATFDLTGLPPTPAEVEAFRADPSPLPVAFAAVVDRLLASPHYGERWARHWMDLVRFAETSGHEFDYNIPAAYRYRDYLIRAFNRDVPYDQFVVEHVAGDLLPEPRRDPATGQDESSLATGFSRLHEGVHSPVDLPDDASARVDNQVDTLGKAFLGLTIACARCHDHKFDAITTRDYYALAGFFRSSRHSLAILDRPETLTKPVAELVEVRRRIAAEVGPPEASGVDSAATSTSSEVFETFDRDDYAGWFASGQAFGDRPTAVGAFRVDEKDRVAPIAAGQAHSGAISDRLRGVLRSRTFTISRPKIFVLASGRGGRINVVIDGFEKIRSPIYGGLVVDVNDGTRRAWRSIDVAQWVGLPAYIEIDDGLTIDFTDNVGSIRPGGGFIAVDEIRFGDGPAPSGPAPVDPPMIPADAQKRLKPLVDQFRSLEAALPDPTLGQALADGSAVDARVQIRGSARNLGEPEPRRFLAAVGDLDAKAGAAIPEAGRPGSGRLSLARSIASPDNPLTARVLVNRLWHHHFGRGLVPSVDDFGAMGQPPSHPELLDFLAARLVESGWSIKAIHREIVLSRAYRMSSRPDVDGDRVDPTNRLLHRANLRRLDAESIRDAILATSGRLDPRMFGPSVAPHLTPFMDGRGRPAKSGPLDGEGRRTIYLNVRRNFLTPMLQAFDLPTPSAAMGRRNVSNVPAQALTMLNDPFVADQARAWAERIVADRSLSDDAGRVDRMYLEAFARPPSADEREAAVGFLGSSKDSRAWADLAHALFNVKEFLLIP